MPIPISIKPPNHGQRIVINRELLLERSLIDANVAHGTKRTHIKVEVTYGRFSAKLGMSIIPGKNLTAKTVTDELIELCLNKIINDIRELIDPILSVENIA